MESWDLHGCRALYLITKRQTNTTTRDGLQARLQKLWKRTISSESAPSVMVSGRWGI